MTFAKTGFYLFKSANIIFKLNKYLVMGFTVWGMWKLFNNLIYQPLRAVSYFFYVQSRPLTNLPITYGQGLVIITGPTVGLGPAYCKTLIRAGFRNFLLIDEDQKELDSLRKGLYQFIRDVGKDQSSVNLEIFVFDFDDGYSPEKFATIDEKMKAISGKEERRISILINNFGKMRRGDFESMDYNDIALMINSNINAITYMPLRTDLKTQIFEIFLSNIKCSR